MSIQSPLSNKPYPPKLEFTQHSASPPSPIQSPPLSPTSSPLHAPSPSPSPPPSQSPSPSPTPSPIPSPILDNNSSHESDQSDGASISSSEESDDDFGIPIAQPPSRPIVNYQGDIELEEDYDIGWEWFEVDPGPHIAPYTGFQQCLLDPMKN